LGFKPFPAYVHRHQNSYKNKGSENPNRPFFGGWEGWFHPKVYQVILSHDAQVEKIPGRWLDAWPSLAATIAGKSSQLKGDGSSKPSFVGWFSDGSNVCFCGCRDILGASNT